MNNTDSKYNKLIAKLHLAEPLIDNPMELTDAILDAIRKDKIRKTPGRSVLWLRTLSSAAAIFLIGLFLFQANQSFVPQNQVSYSQIFNSRPANTDFCTGSSGSKFKTKKELLLQYMCYIQKNAASNKMLRKYYQNPFQAKNK